MGGGGLAHLHDVHMLHRDLKGMYWGREKLGEGVAHLHDVHMLHRNLKGMYWGTE